MEIVELIKVLWLRKWIFILAFVIVCVAAFLCDILMRPTYESVAQVLVQRSESAASVLSSIGLNDARQNPETTEDMATEAALATTDTVLQEVIDRLSLKDRHGKPLTTKKFTSWIWVWHALLPRPNVDVDQVEDSMVITITARATDPKEAKNIADALAEIYAGNSVKRRIRDFQRARTSVNQRLEDVHRNYLSALKEAEQLRTAPLTPVSDTNQMVVTSAALTENSMVEYLKKALATLEPQLQATLLEKTENHPDVVSLKEQVVITRELLQRELSIYRNTADVDFKIANAKTLYTAIQALGQRLDLAETAALSNVTVVQPGTTPSTAKPKSPDDIIIAFLAVLLGGMAGVAAVFAAHYLDDSVRAPDSLESIGIRCLAVVPKNHRLAGLSNDDSPSTHASVEAYRSLRNNIRRAGEHVTVVMASLNRGEGRTTTALHLAAACARERKRTILIDADLRNPRIHTILGLRRDGGLSDAIKGDAKPDSFLQPTGVEGLSVVTAGSTAVDPAALIDHPNLPDVFKALRNRSDVIIFDAPSLATSEDILVLAGHAQTLVFVTEEGVTSSSEVQQAVSKLKAAGSTVFGGVLNKHVNRWTFSWLRRCLLWT